MKKIEIKGKNNIERKNIQKWKYPEDVLDKKNQVSLLNKLYLDEIFNGKEDIKCEITKKLGSYKQQDKKRDLKGGLISYSDCLEYLVLSKLKCYYCRCKMLLMYSEKRDEIQWTLDRINNDMGHNKNNVVICCLKCNLKKRRQNDEKFKFTKQLKIIKGF
jgi:hypothetical protein